MPIKTKEPRQAVSPDIWRWGVSHYIFIISICFQCRTDRKNSFLTLTHSKKTVIYRGFLFEENTCFQEILGND